MSITISNWKEICDANTNRSPSKMAYSFSKAHRFHPHQENRSPPLYLDPRSSTKPQEKTVEEPPASGMETNMTSPKSNHNIMKACLLVHPQILMNFPPTSKNLKQKDFVLEKEELK